MTNPILSGGVTDLNAIRSAILPHIKSFTGMNYKKKDDIINAIFDVRDTNMFYDEYTEIAPLGRFKEKDEFEEGRRDSLRQTHLTRATQIDWMLIHQISDKAIRFNQHPDKLALDSAEHLSRAAFHSMQRLGTIVLDESRDSSHVGGDGQPLLSTTHPIVDGSSVSNELATAMTFSQEGIHELLLLMRAMKDPRGEPLALRANKLVVPTAKWIKAQEILATEYQLNTANNNANVLVSNKLLPGGIVNLDYSNDSSAYYVLADTADVKDGLVCNRSVELDIDSDADKATRTINVYGFFSNVFFFHDWRIIAGTAGI